MLWIGQEWPAADALPNETLEAWKARGAPCKTPQWWIWAPAGPGDAEPVYGPYASKAAARNAADRMNLEVLERYPCGCPDHGDEL